MGKFVIFCTGGAAYEIGRRLWEELPRHVRAKIEYIVFIDSDTANVGYFDDISEGTINKWRRKAHDNKKIEIFNININTISRGVLTKGFKSFINNPVFPDGLDPNLAKIRKGEGVNWKEYMTDEYIDLFKTGAGGVSRRRSASSALFTSTFFHDINSYKRLESIVTVSGLDGIIIITSFGGGTGSGIHIQLARLIKYLTKGQVEIYLIGILPHEREDKLVKANALYALAEHIYLERGKERCNDKWYDENPFTYVFLFNANRYGGDWNKIDRAIVNFIHILITGGSKVKNFHGFSVRDRKQQCEEAGRFFVSAGSYIIKYPMDEICNVINTCIETTREVNELNKFEERLYSKLDLREKFNRVFERVREKYRIKRKRSDEEVLKRTNELLAQIRTYINNVSRAEMKIVEDVGRLLKEVEERGEFEEGSEHEGTRIDIAKLRNIGELILNNIENLKKLHEDFKGFELKSIEASLRRQKDEFEEKLDDMGRESNFSNITILKGIISNFYENILASIRFSMLKEDIEELEKLLPDVKKELERELTHESSEKICNMLRYSVEYMKEFLDDFIKYILNSFAGKLETYEDIRRKLIDYANKHEREIKNPNARELEDYGILDLIDEYLRIPFLIRVFKTLTVDIYLHDIKNYLREKAGTLRIGELRKIKKEMNFYYSIQEEISNSFKEAREKLMSPYEQEMKKEEGGIKTEAKKTYKGLLRAVTEALREFKNVRGKIDLIEAIIEPSDKFRGYILTQKMLGNDLMRFKEKQEVIKEEDQGHIDDNNPAIKMWDVHEIGNVEEENVKSAYICIKGNDFIHIGMQESKGSEGIYIPLVSYGGALQGGEVSRADLSNMYGGDVLKKYYLWDMYFLTICYYLRAEDFDITRWLCEAIKGEEESKKWWHERYSILVEYGEDAVKGIEEEIKRICERVSKV